MSKNLYIGLTVLVVLGIGYWYKKEKEIQVI